MSILERKRSIINQFIYLKWQISLHHHTRISPVQAMDILKNYYQKEKPAFRQGNVVDPIVDLQIIVPVYNVEEYLEECICSLLNQKTEFSYNIVVVNDGSTDNSGLILKRYREDSRIIIIEQMNGGLSSARNRALRKIHGKYVMFVDSDDILQESAIQNLMEIAYRHDADIVEGGHQLFNSSGWGAIQNHSEKVLKCNSSELFGYAWGKVIRSDRLIDFCFPDSFLFEDTVMHTLLYPSCAVTYTIPDIVYYYRENNSGITQTSGTSPRCIDTFWIMKYCLEERVNRGQKLKIHDFENYLLACFRNWGRTKNMPLDIQESIFVLSCDLLNTYFKQCFKEYAGKYSRLLKAIEHQSFDAFLITVKNWWIM